MNDKDVVRVTGADTWSFLQSLLSQDVLGMEQGERRSALMLTPQGKVEVLLGVVREGDDALLDTDSGWGEALKNVLSRYKIRTAVEVSLESLGDEPSDQSELERIQNGTPRMGFDLDSSVIPQEAALEIESVSFTKGCFVGQELVCRIDSRGHVNRHLRLITNSSEVTLVKGDSLLQGGKVVGEITSSAPGFALGYVRREVEIGSTLEVSGTVVRVLERPVAT
ncbi:folate-binding protein YgfZ [Actinobacteria bacterium IMCC26256]|nr:folate-binding protein YgfZ [Actinobacteria bacterium IMCC26256]